jgi:cation diffusion facilitator family transporter
VIGVSAVANLAVSTYLYRQAHITESPALGGDAAHLRTDAFTSIGVLVGLVLVELTGATWLDPTAALIVAGAIVFAGVRILSRSSRALVDEALPEDEMNAVRQIVAGHGAPELIGFHKLRARRAGSRRYVDLHLQFRDGTSLRRAHEISHELQREIALGCAVRTFSSIWSPRRPRTGGPASGRAQGTRVDVVSRHQVGSVRLTRAG